MKTCISLSLFIFFKSKFSSFLVIFCLAYYFSTWCVCIFMCTHIMNWDCFGLAFSSKIFASHLQIHFREMMANTDSHVPQITWNDCCLRGFNFLFSFPRGHPLFLHLSDVHCPHPTPTPAWYFITAVSYIKFSPIFLLIFFVFVFFIFF